MVAVAATSGSPDARGAEKHAGGALRGDGASLCGSSFGPAGRATIAHWRDKLAKPTPPATEQKPQACLRRRQREQDRHHRGPAASVASTSDCCFTSEPRTLPIPPRLIAAIAIAAIPAGSLAQSAPHEQRARAIFKELIDINTTDTPAGNVTTAAEAAAARLKAAGWADGDLQVIGPAIRGSTTSSRGGAAPARSGRCCCSRTSTSSRPSARTGRVDPFTFLERDGWFYGRGTQRRQSAWRRNSWPT